VQDTTKYSSEITILTFCPSATLDLGLNDISGNIPAQVGDMISLTALALDFNRLTGALPKEIGDLSNSLGEYMESHRPNEMDGGLLKLFCISTDFIFHTDVIILCCS
jgi:hypothetical protein